MFKSFKIRRKQWQTINMGHEIQELEEEKNEI